MRLRDTEMIRQLARLWPESHGQDLTEYALLLAFVVLAAGGLFIGAGGSIESIWGYSSTTLGCAASAMRAS